MNSNKPFIEKKIVYPQIYVYSDENYPGWLKVGYTTRKNPEDRIKEQYPILLPCGIKPYSMLWHEASIRDDGSIFIDKDVHKYLKNNGIECSSGEWFKCSLDAVKAAIIAVKKRIRNTENRTETFELRYEQEAAIKKTIEYYIASDSEINNRKPHFLWNCKMRFGKTFTTYQLAKRMGFKRVLILTFKPAVMNSWKEDLNSHIDFEGWQFIDSTDVIYEEIDKEKPIVTFGSFQDYLGKAEDGSVKQKNKWVYDIEWDLMVFDEYHFGAWREAAKELYSEDGFEENLEELDKNNIIISAKRFLYLSGTPFRAISNGEFIEEQIYSWTYNDEQQAKANWKGKNNPYKKLPEVILLTYKLPEEIRNIASKGEYDEFDLNTFFSAEDIDCEYTFKYKNEVQKWLDLIRGSLQETSLDSLKLGAEKPPFPFSDVRLMSNLSHTLWFLPSVSSCYAMKNLLSESQNSFYKKYKVIVAAGTAAGIGAKALQPVEQAIGSGLNTNTITLTCGKLTTGVTVKPWTAIFMLRNLKSPETYFQSAFRVQSPWNVQGEEDEIIIKEQCYIFDFAPKRALAQIASYCDNINTERGNIVDKVQEFIKFLPVLAYDGFAMEQVDAAGLLDIAMGRTTATLLAKGWNNALLVNVDNITFKRVLEDDKALNTIMSIEGFRNAKRDISIIINNEKEIKDLEDTSKHRDLSPGERKKKSDKEKENKDKRAMIRDNLKILASRIPLFMYLTDKREENLQDVITQIEPQLFNKVTGLTMEDFNILVDIGLFNRKLMNYAVYNFRKYEDSSMSYAGINKHLGEAVGGFDMVLSEEEYLQTDFKI
ncbi:MAG: GIY-YIG nuclease family protein [Clostridiaceae bacterium]